MAQENDIIICGTGLVECVLSSLLSQEGKKVLHIDRNPFNGGEGASLNLASLWKLFRPGVQLPKDIGINDEWDVDLIPKFFRSNGNLVKLLAKTGLSDHIEWKDIASTYVYQVIQDGYFSKGGPKISKVPNNDQEVLKSDLLGLLEKNRCKNFFLYIQNYDVDDPKTHRNIDLTKEKFSALARKFNLSPNIVEFLGHATAFYTDDSFTEKPAIEVVQRINAHIKSCSREETSSFVYPAHGMKAIFDCFPKTRNGDNSTFVSGRDIDEILYDEEGKVCGVKYGGEIAKCKTLICHPSYIMKTGNRNKVKRIGKVVRCICILDHPVPHTNDDSSFQLIIPQKQVGRKSDIFVNMISNSHQVCKQGFYIAVISTLVETEDPEKELNPALEVLGPIAERFMTISDLYIPISDFSDNIFITNSLDPQSNFESAADNILQLYKKITGKDVELSPLLEDNRV